MTGKTTPAAQSTFSRSYIASAPYLNPTPIEAFPGSAFLPGAVPQRPTGNPLKWMNQGFSWNGKQFPGNSMWGPFGNGYHFPGQGYWAAGYNGYGYYPFGWGGDGTFLAVGDSALRAWAGEPVDGYPPEGYPPGAYGGPMPWAGMPAFFPNQSALPEGMAFAQFTGVPETIVLDFPPGSRVRR
jgi:hypothetical protein